MRLFWLNAFLALAITFFGIYFVYPSIVLNWGYQVARWRAGLKRKEIFVAGHKISYLEGGTGEPLLLIHGFGANKDHWTMVSGYLTKKYTVYAIDLPGFGESSRLEDERYSVVDQMSRMLVITKTLGLENFHLGGNSMGGYLSALFANKYPEKVASLWLLAPAGAETARPSEVLEMIERGENPLITETMEDFDRLGNLCFDTLPHVPKQFRKSMFEQARRDAPFNKKIFDDMFSEAIGLEKSLQDIQIPTLLVWGDNDRVLHPSGLDICSALFANKRAILMPKMGHVPMVERPRDCANDYLQFGKDLESRAPL